MTKISQLSDIGANLAANDEFIIRDVSDASTPNKKVTSSGFVDYIIAQGTGAGFTQIAAGVGPLARALASSSGATGTLTFSTAAATTLIERARIDSSGRLLVGTSSASILRYGVNTAKIETISDDYHLALRSNLNANGAPAATFVRTRANAIVQNGDALGDFEWRGHDGTDVESIAASIGAVVDGTPGANDMPGRLVFSTTTDGAATPTERMRIDNAGRVLVGTGTANASGAKLQTSDGLTFPATAVASADPNTLDDYEEGTWTPTQDTFDTWTTPTFTATYTKVGRVVHLNLYQTGGTVGWSALDSIGGLPFTPGTIAVGYATDTTPASDNGAIVAYTNSKIYFQKANASETGLVFSVTYHV